jgi:hypothetical protein
MFFMTIRITCILFLFLLPFSSFSQDTISKKGTVTVRKSDKKHSPSKRAKQEKKRITTYYFNDSQYKYKITFPESYKSNLYPLDFGSSTLAIADENENLTENQLVSTTYELFNSNIFIERKFDPSGSLMLFQDLFMLPVGSSVWVVKLVYKEPNGNENDTEITSFKIEKIGKM